MAKEDLRLYFNDANRITEIYSIARELKKKGFDVAEVNVVATEKKKELIAKINSVKTLTKVIPKSETIRKTPTTFLIIKTVSINSGKIEITSNHEVLL